MTKSIELRLPEWANWIAQDEDSSITEFEDECFIDHSDNFFISYRGKSRSISRTQKYIQNWRESKINLNTDSCYIDEHGILRKVESK